MRQGVESLEGSPVVSGPLFHLPLVNHMDGFSPAQSNPSTPERFESQRRSDLLFDEPVVLFNHVIEVFTFSDFDPFIVFLVIAFDPCFVRSALVNVYLGSSIIRFHRFVQKPQSRLLITLCSENKINRQAFFIDGTLKIHGRPN